jgi:hypothetical protein
MNRGHAIDVRDSFWVFRRLSFAPFIANIGLLLANIGSLLRDIGLFSLNFDLLFSNFEPFSLKNAAFFNENEAFFSVFTTILEKLSALNHSFLQYLEFEGLAFSRF